MAKTSKQMSYRYLRVFTENERDGNMLMFADSAVEPRGKVQRMAE